MRNIFIALAIILAIDFWLISFYCKRQKNYENNRMKKQNMSIELPKSNIDENMKKAKMEKFLKFYHNFMDSLLRLNVFIVSEIPSHFVRRIFLIYICKMEIHPKAVIYSGFEIRAPWNITIGKGAIIGDKSILDGRCGIRIGENVNLSTGVWIWTLQHDYNDSYFLTKNQGNPVIIEDWCWISCRTILLPGVTVKRGAVVAAGGIVTEDCDEYCVYGGVPAKKIGERNRELKYNFAGDHMYFY